MTIPLVDLARQHDAIADEVEAGFKEVMARGDFIRGSRVSEFESAFAGFCGAAHCIGVGSGTDAIELAVRGIGLGAGDQVIVPANSFIASALGVVRAGVDVILVDADPETHLIDVAAAVDAIGPRTRAIMPVHLYGQMADIRQLLDVAGEIPIIEDAAQSQGAQRDGFKSGSAGLVGATSFYPGKNIGAYGDGGAVTTDDPAIAQRIRALGNWGSDVKYHHPVTGFNSRLDTLQAVVLNAKLERLAKWNSERDAAARFYDSLLADVDDVQRPVVAPKSTHVWHLYVVRVPRRDVVLQKLQAQGIGAGVHYPIPMHLQPALSDLGYPRGSFPVAESAAGQILSLPMFPGITEPEQERVVESLLHALSS